MGVGELEQHRYESQLKRFCEQEGARPLRESHEQCRTWRCESEIGQDAGVLEGIL